MTKGKENIETISTNSICNVQEIMAFTCSPCGRNNASSYRVKDMKSNPKFLMCNGGCVNAFDGVFFAVSCTFVL